MCAEQMCTIAAIKSTNLPECLTQNLSLEVKLTPRKSFTFKTPRIVVLDRNTQKKDLIFPQSQEPERIKDEEKVKHDHLPK